MLNSTLTTLIICGILCGNLTAQDDAKKKPADSKKATELKSEEKVKVTEKTTALSEKASPSKELETKIEEMPENLHNTAAPKIELSDEMKSLIGKRESIIQELNDADKEINKLIKKSEVWDKERNTEKKGQLDTILDKADRLAFSNELRMNLSTQAKLISAIIKKLNLNEVKIAEQKIEDEKKRQMEAYKKYIEKLERERKALLAKIKAQENGDSTVNATEAIQKKNEENVEYFTITEDTNLQIIALQYYQDHEKWIIIYDHPDNKQVLKQKSPTAIIPIGSVLTIPKIIEK